MSAVPQALDAQVPPLEVHETRDFRSYHAFLRAARNYIEGPLLAALARDCTPGSTIDPDVANHLKHPAR